MGRYQFIEGILIKSENLKIVTVSFLILSFLAGFVTKVLFETLAVAFGSVAQFYNRDIFYHGVPLAVAFGCFLFFQFKPDVRELADEVVTEVRKVVWPTKKELYAMTSVVCLILVVSGVVLGLFDLAAGTTIKFFLE